MNWKHWLYIVYIVLAALVASGIISSCSVYHGIDAKGCTRIVTTDTTLINHLGTYKFSH
jgi:hypothetical protein